MGFTVQFENGSKIPWWWYIQEYTNKKHKPPEQAVQIALASIHLGYSVVNPTDFAIPICLEPDGHKQTLNFPFLKIPHLYSVKTFVTCKLPNHLNSGKYLRRFGYFSQPGPYRVVPALIPFHLHSVNTGGACTLQHCWQTAGLLKYLSLQNLPLSIQSFSSFVSGSLPQLTPPQRKPYGRVVCASPEVGGSMADGSQQQQHRCHREISGWKTD